MPNADSTYLLALQLHIFSVVERFDCDSQKDVQEDEGADNKGDAEEDNGNPALVKDAAVSLNARVHDPIPVFARQHLQ